jgi:hypothetical protein
MNKDYTDIIVVQDRSASMQPIRKETIQGFNIFLEDQKKAPGKCAFTLLQFNTEFILCCSGKDIQSVEPLTEQTYAPAGSTALLDAIATTISTTGQRLESMNEEERPARVIFAILTDGEENSSRTFRGLTGRAKVFEMIKHQTERYNWQFVFLGANQDAIQAGEGIGVAASNAISTSNTSGGVAAAYESLSDNTRRYRASDPAAIGALRFSASQREKQYAEGAAMDSMAKPTIAPPTDKDKKAC